MAQPAATAGFPQDLEDQTKWKCVRAVPVFKPHVRVLPEFKDPTGKVWPEVKIAVTAADLPYIAAETNRAGPQPATVGHRDPRPDYPEALQPKPVGWETNHRTGTFSADGKRQEPCILADLYYRLDEYDASGPHAFPFRSVDYDFQTKRITGLAVLRRRPFLDLGVIPYAHRRATTVQYAFESDPSTGAPAMDDQFTPEEEAQYAKICRYMAKKHPRMAAYMDGMGATAPGPTNAAPPAPYADPQARAAAEAAARQLLAPLKGVVKFNEDREAALMAGMGAAAQPAHVQYMMDTYQRVNPTPAAVPVATATPAAAQPKHADGTPAMTQRQMDMALQYAATANVPYEAARIWAMSNIPATA
jgi:hypothetical protein